MTTLNTAHNAGLTEFLQGHEKYQSGGFPYSYALIYKKVFIDLGSQLKLIKNFSDIKI